MKALAPILAAPILAALWPGLAAADCRQALAIGLDVSGSVDSGEYMFQLRGMASALDDPEVRAALLLMPEAPVAVSVYHWSGAQYQRLLLDWVLLDSDDTITRAVDALDGFTWRPAPHETAVGGAMLHGIALLAERPDCLRLTLDIAGDGRSNSGPRPGGLDLTVDGRAVTVNALVIAPPGGGAGDPGSAELAAYFAAEVLRGPEAFVEVATGYDDFRDAMVRKLLKELAVMQVSQTAPVLPDRHPVGTPPRQNPLIRLR